MAIIIRTVFNNQDWRNACQNANHDRRLYQCHERRVNTDFKILETRQCSSAECWEQHLCKNYSWYNSKGDFGERATGKAYFIYPDTDKKLVLWGKSEIKSVENNILNFQPFKPLPKNRQISGLTYKELQAIGVPEWGSRNYRYISDETANILDTVISEGVKLLTELSEEYHDFEGQSLLRQHVIKERSSKLIKAFKSQLTNFSCSVCGFSFEKFYGELGSDFIEAHHTKPIAELTAQTKITVNDLAAVCSNCHRMLHRSNPPLSIAKLKRLIKK
ncbi:MAG: HNH endonuclease [Desulfamplus sp.]|nr:HNH endonuclease [Desulfamplus sp.]